MGQTLTHGVYLPDEGERNCYSGLAANWQLLDGAVGTVAEHTTALAGKAPAVHTHTVSDITDFPVYGTTAGTICEGNDSRLSDARTPVAHTHTKSDVTDLLNSNFIPSANNSYDLGSSSYQWNNLYAKNYYYNGTAWGLDKVNVWSNINSYQREITITGDRNAYIAPMWEGAGSGIAFLSLDASKQFVFGQRTTDANNRSCFDATKGFLVIKTGETAEGTTVSVIPSGTDTKLGTSTNKWKTFNGINPGALSLPNYSDNTYIDISGSIVPPSGETTINYSGGENQYTPPVDGWLSIRCDNATFLQIFRNTYNCPGTTASRQDANGKLVVTLPVLKNTTYTIIINTSGTTNKFQLYPCLGNV